MRTWEGERAFSIQCVCCAVSATYGIDLSKVWKSFQAVLLVIATVEPVLEWVNWNGKQIFFVLNPKKVKEENEKPK